MSTTLTTRGRTGRLAAALIGLTALVGACANNPPTSAAGAGSPSAAAPAAAVPVGGSAATQPGPAGALLGTSTAGEILVGPDGRTLYGFTNDTAAASTCYGTCAVAWPPVIVGPDWTVGPRLDTGIFATTVRDDGQLQLVAGKWPLYYYTGDAGPGDINGQGSGSVWFLVDPKGKLVTGAGDATTASTPKGSSASGGYGAAKAPAADKPAGGGLVGSARTSLGAVLTSAEGRTLYGFTADTGGKPSCYDACATAWPPVLVNGAELPAGLDPTVFSVVKRTDGTFQLKAGDWPIYRFGGDAAPGDVNGQGSGGKWFAAGPDGKLIKA